MPVGSIISGVASLGSAALGSSAAKSAARAQREGAQRGIAEVQGATQRGQEWQAPYRELGTEAAGNLSDMITPGYDYTASPGYQFRFNEGQRAVDGSGAARGMAFSGSTLKDLIKFGQGVATDDFNQSFGRNLSLASLGQNAATTSGNMGMTGANTLANLYTGQGNSNAAGIVGSANSWQQGIGNIASLAQSFGGGSPYSRLKSSAASTIAANPGIF